MAIMESSDIPDPPRPRPELFNSAAMKGIRPAFRRDPGEVTIDCNGERFKIEIDCGDLQPGRSIKSDEFFVAQSNSGELALAGRVFAENLPAPKDFALVISANVTRTTMTLDSPLNPDHPASTDQ
jgi:hypothetical protein